MPDMRHRVGYKTWGIPTNFLYLKLRQEGLFRHSRAGGNPVEQISIAAFLLIPAFAGMTAVSIV
jgi:hypothetical protein